MWREIPGVLIYILFLAGFVFAMNFISNSDPNFVFDPNLYSFIGAAIILFTTLMVYWERIFPSGD